MLTEEKSTVAVSLFGFVVETPSLMAQESYKHVVLELEAVLYSGELVVISVSLLVLVEGFLEIEQKTVAYWMKMLADVKGAYSSLALVSIAALMMEEREMMASPSSSITLSFPTQMIYSILKKFNAQKFEVKQTKHLEHEK